MPVVQNSSFHVRSLRLDPVAGAPSREDRLQWLLSRLVAGAGCPAAVFLPLLAIGESVHIADVHTAGDVPRGFEAAALQGRAIDAMGWSAGHLLPLNEPAERTLPLSGAAPQPVFGGLVSVDGRVLGWLGAMLGPRGLLSPRRARSCWHIAREALPHQGDAAPPPSLSAAKVVVDPDGCPVAWGPNAGPWLESTRFHRRLRAVVDAASVAKRSPLVRLVGQVMLEVTRLSCEGGARFLVQITPGRSLPEPAVARLTPSQLQVATFAAAGATAAEIARSLDRSPETIRTHIKRVYALLGVANRVELSQVMEGTWSGGA